jgi:hypothetical protein
MSDESNEKLVQRYLDGDLNAAERAAFKQQLREDASLKELLQEYTLLKQDLKDLDGAKLPRDYWSKRLKPAMEEELGIENRPFLEKLSELFNVSITSLKPALVAIAFVTVVIATTFFLQNSFTDEQEKPYERAFTRIENLRQEFLTELHVLLDEMDSRKEHMVPAVLTAYEDGLEAINNAIEVAERYYAMNADKQEAITRLLTAYDRKATFLKQFLSLNLYENGGYNESK